MIEALDGLEGWIVGGAVRDRLLGRETTDIDVAITGDVRAQAKRMARRVRGAAFELGAFGGWRVVARQNAWHVDLVPLQGGSIEADLARRDFTINAMAEPLGGGDLLDPYGGRADLERRLVRMVSARSLADDPLRALRAVRLAVELDLELEPETAAATTAHAPELDRVSAERVFAEFKRVIAAPAVRRGLALMEAHGLTAVVLPELLALHGLDQSVYHHADVHDHTLEVLDEVLRLPGVLGDEVTALLAEPLSDELTRGEAMRFAALLHDAAKPQTRGELPGGRVTFIGHDAEGAQLARTVLGRLKTSQRLRDYVAALISHHLDVGFLVHQRPLGPRTVWRYLRATEPYAADVVAFTVADRLATRGRNADAAIEGHLDVASTLLEAAFAETEQAPLIRGDELARELGMTPGPQLGGLLAQLAEDRYAGAISTREEALARARELLDG